MPVLDVTHWICDEERQAPGTRSKFWLVNPGDGKKWLFKLPYENTGEAWAETVASKLGTLLTIQTAETGLACYEGSVGSLSLNFAESDDGEFFQGGADLNVKYCL